MAETNQDLHRDCVNRIIELANQLKDEGVDINLVNAALMTASGLYASYVVGGNQGGLSASGVDKVTEVYRRELARIQEIKKQSPAH